MAKNWWKVLAVICLLYTVYQGFLGDVPRLDILNETIRNLYFHVTMWFAMMILMTVALVYSIKYLTSNTLSFDTKAKNFGVTGFVMGCLGIVTGSVWAKFTWGTYWVNDPKLNGAAITLLAYLAYFILRGSLDDEAKRARLAAVYNIFAYVLLMIFLMILPRMTDSLHPGNGGNPAFGEYDLDSNMRAVFYPAIIGWTLLGVWITSLRNRIDALEEEIEE